MKKIVFYILFILLFFNSFSQSRTQMRIEVADELYENEQFIEAINIYERILRREDDVRIRQEVSFKIGNSFRRILDYEESVKWYNIALNLGYDNPELYLFLSEMNLGLEQFDTAIDFAQRYLQMSPDDYRGQKLLESAHFAKENYYTETLFEVANERRINSPGQEWGVAFIENVTINHPDQAVVDQNFDIEVRIRHNNLFYWAWVSRVLKERIVFSSTTAREEQVEGQGFSNIYQVTYNRRESDWDPPKLVQGINSPYYDGFFSYDETNEIAYFMNSGGTDGNRPTSDIYFSQYQKQTDSWETPQMFPFNDINYDIGYPSISTDGNTLYFASNMSGGHGGFDIYKIEKDENGQWGDPMNLGDVINTPFNDSYPFIEGNVLYFSSYGHPGFGGFDVFYSVIDENGNYSQPINMGAPVNSSADDFGFIIDKNYTRGFYSSSRPGGEGADDIYSFRIIARTFTLSGRLINKETGNGIPNHDVIIMNEVGDFADFKSTDANGYYQFENLSTSDNFTISGFPTDNYEGFEEELAVRNMLVQNRFEVITNLERDISVTPVEGFEEVEPVTDPEPDPEPEMPIATIDPIEEDPAPQIQDEEKPITDEGPKQVEFLTLNSEGFPIVYFDFGKFQLTNYAKLQLDSVVAFMNQNRDKGLIIHAHTDEVSSYLFNFYLSQRRAQSIIEYMTGKGIENERLYPKGHGKMQLAVSNATTTEEHQLNRRANFESISQFELQAYLENASTLSFRYLNSLQKDAHYASGIEFMVQFIASKNPVNPSFYNKIMSAFPHSDIIYYYDTDRFHRYLVGSFSNFEDAFSMQRKLRELGYDIYIVAFNNGERIPVSRARRIIAGDI